MGMLDEIEKLMAGVGTSANYRLINLGGKYLYVEGIKSVVSFGVEEMQFQLKKCLLVVAGKNLKVKYLDKSTSIIEGEIFSCTTKN